jgi:hypothetical protein
MICELHFGQSECTIKFDEDKPRNRTSRNWYGLNPCANIAARNLDDFQQSHNPVVLMGNIFT